MKRIITNYSFLIYLTHKEKSCPNEAWKCYFTPFDEIMTNSCQLKNQSYPTKASINFKASPTQYLSLSLSRDYLLTIYILFVFLQTIFILHSL